MTKVSIRDYTAKEQADNEIEFWLEVDGDDGGIDLKARLVGNPVDTGWNIAVIEEGDVCLDLCRNIGSEMADAGMKLDKDGRIVVKKDA